ncbi:MAG: hypothetical protein CSA74_00520 [Rhodobacterales bacterium]|nr:MAG: hypothetical protein CSA74_00520 [Rhodobacterales bacterium]
MALRKASQSSRAARTVHSLFAEAGSLPRRESLLGALAAGSPDTGPDTGGGIGDGFDTRPALARIQSAEATAEGVLFAIVPRIDPDLCSGCDACVRICPPEALTLIDTPGGLSAYHVDPESCDACGLCESVCEESAIRLETMALAPKDIPLQSWACRACGVAVHGPQAAAEGRAQDGLCRICARTGHHKKLFQVLS